MDWIRRELSGVVLSPPGTVSDDDVEAINNIPNPPPLPVTTRDVYVRTCRIAGDAVDAGFGRFRTEDLPRLLAMIQGAPALIGHRRDTLGIARFFGGSLWTDAATGITYAAPKFYWMRAHSASEDLRVCIDGGIYSEASLGFIFRRPTCGVCGEDIRRCEHMPGQEYNGETCFYWYDDILRVTEGSFVYRGAEPGTGFTLGDPDAESLAELPRFRWGGIWYRGIPEKLTSLKV